MFLFLAGGFSFPVSPGSLHLLCLSFGLISLTCLVHLSFLIHICLPIYSLLVEMLLSMSLYQRLYGFLGVLDLPLPFMLHFAFLKLILVLTPVCHFPAFPCFHQIINCIEVSLLSLHTNPYSCVPGPQHMTAKMTLNANELIWSGVQL